MSHVIEKLTEIISTLRKIYQAVATPLSIRIIRPCVEIARVQLVLRVDPFSLLHKIDIISSLVKLLNDLS